MGFCEGYEEVYTIGFRVKDNCKTVEALELFQSALLAKAFRGERNTQIAGRCLDIWDMLFENRVGRVMELTRAIEK
ncbi:MAG: hypothetical protein JRE40_08505 [Deltaproteobacteria bacterium]|nr:hypothetical protein [Deltaproteobacteria bacterium]MBW2673947.1 hypothetical protein [Deltaproteobacteria bacterium]